MTGLLSAEGLFWERLLTDRTLQDIADEYAVTPSAVFASIQKCSRRHLDAIELQLMVCFKEGSLLTLLVPDQAAESQALALRYFDFVVRELEKRDVKTEPHFRAAPDGSVVFALEWIPTPEAEA